MVVFGTSLSDTGNAFAAVGRGQHAAGLPAGSAAGAERAVREGRPPLHQRPHLGRAAGRLARARRQRQARVPGRGPVATNYAVGGGRAHDDGQNLNLSAQVDAFLEASGGVASPSALYVIEMGGNDIRDALVAYPTRSHVVIQQALVRSPPISGASTAAGARHFLVWSAPNPALTPAVRYLATSFRAPRNSPRP